MISVNQIKNRLVEIQERIHFSSTHSQVDSSLIEIMAVTKTHSLSVVEMAIDAGVSLIGENRVKEAREKMSPKLENIQIHLIGHLQRNKVRAAVNVFDCIQSIDKIETAISLQKALKEADRTIDVLLQLNTSADPNKSGFVTEEALYMGLDKIEELDRLCVRGLMTVAAYQVEEKDLRICFSRLRELFENLKKNRKNFNVLSMGMSGDFEIAVEEGSNHLRLGSILFGERKY